MRSPTMKKSAGFRATFSEASDSGPISKSGDHKTLSVPGHGPTLSPSIDNVNTSLDDSKKTSKHKKHGHDTHKSDGSSDGHLLNDGTKQFREEATITVETIFDDLKKNLILMEFENRLSSYASMKREENAYFKQQDSENIKRLKARQEKEMSRVNEAFKEATKAREFRKKAILHQIQLDATAEINDTIIEELEESQRISLEINEVLDDYRDNFDALLKQLEIQHTKVRKQLSFTQERRLQDKKTLHELEVANMTEEMRLSSNKRFQFQVNHQKAMDKKVSEHYRAAQLLVIRQTKEMFEFEIKGTERMYDMKAHMWEETNRLTHQQLREHQGMEFMIRELQFRQTTNTSILRHHFNTARIASRNKENLQLEIRTQKSREVALIEAWAALEKKTKQSRQEVDEFYLNKAVLETPPSLFICEKLIATFELAKDHLVGMESGHYTEQDFQQFLSSKGDKGEKSTNSLFAVQDPQIIRDQLKKAEQDLKALTHAHAQQLSQLKKKLEEEFAELVRKIQKEYNALKLSQLEARQNLEKVQEEELIHLRSAHEKESQMSDSIMKSEHTMLLERKRLNLMLQGIADGIITIDNAGIILRFNSSAERIFGYTSKEIMGKNVKMLQPTYIAENHDSYLKNYLETGIYKVIGTRRTTLGRKKDGVEFPIKLSVSEVKGDGVHLFTGIIHDLTKETLQIETDKKEVEKRKLEMESLIQQLAVERGRSTDLVNAILPQSISQRLLQDGTVPPEKFNDVTVLFTEISGYSEIVTKYSAMDIVDLLNELYCTFDEVILNYDVYKVETIGDSYVCASGVPTPNKNHAVEIAKLALHFQKAIQYVKMKNYPEVELKLKIGIHSGPLVAGIVGLKCPRYCLFGDTVNTASRMKSVCEPCKINLSHATYQLLAGVDMKPFLMTARGDIAVKGKGAMQTFYLDSMIGLKLSMASVKQMKIADSLKYESTQLEDSNASVNIKQDYKQERHAFSQ